VVLAGVDGMAVTTAKVASKRKKHGAMDKTEEAALLILRASPPLEQMLRNAEQERDREREEEKKTTKSGRQKGWTRGKVSLPPKY
jgi:hypothetical protein